MNYEEESYRLEVNKENKVSTTMFTYSENNNFSGFWFYNDNSSYAVNDKGEIISNSENFNLESGTFVRRIDLNEGEIDESQNDKNDKRIVYIGENVKVDGVSILYNKNTLEIIKCSNGEKDYVGKYYVEFSDSNDNMTQLIVNSDLTGIIYSNKSGYSVTKETTGINFNIIVDNDENKIVYAYRSRDIGNNEFHRKEILLGIHLTTDVKTISAYAFDGCKALTEVIIPSSITTINNGTFTSCKALKEVIIQNGVTSIGNTAFAGCEALTEVIIPSSVTTIGMDVFRNCTALKEVIILSSVTSMGKRAFIGCTALEKVVIEGKLKSGVIDAFNTGSTLTILTIYCNDENTKNRIRLDARANGYIVSFGSLDEYYKNK